MSLNTISARDPINGQPMVDPTSQQSSLSIDAIRIIFQNLKADLPSVALVCKSWKALADSEVFRQMIRPSQAFGTQEWKEYIGVDAGAELRLPRRAYGDLEREDGFLNFIPDKVKIINENGVVEEVILDNLYAIGNLIKYPKTDLITGYSGDAKVEALVEKIKLEKPHWVWLKKEVSNRYLKQELITDEDIPGTDISGAIDTVISVFMEYVRSRKRYFPLNPQNKNTFVVVKDQIKGWRIALGFGRIGLIVVNEYTAHCYGVLDVVLARKSFGF